MRSQGWIALAAAAVAVSIGAGMFANDVTDYRRLRAHVRAITGGDPDRGLAALSQKPCGGCHAIPGVMGATGKVGPSLAAWSGRAYVAGRLPNTPENLEAWIVDPHAIDPRNAMPPTGVTPQEARDMAAYLYTLN